MVSDDTDEASITNQKKKMGQPEGIIFLSIPYHFFLHSPFMARTAFPLFLLQEKETFTGGEKFFL